jgi:hypothetical protein
MATGWQLVAQTELSPCLAAWNREQFLAMMGYTLLFVGAILVLALVIVWVDRWRKRPKEAGTSAGDQLTHFRELYERGELSAEEFARVRGLLSERLREEFQVPAPPPEIELDESAPVPPPSADESKT